MVAIDIYKIGIFLLGAITTVLLTSTIQRILNWRQLASIAIQKRSDEFIELSTKYYRPLAYLVAGLETETDPSYQVRPKVLFFQSAKYLSFCEHLVNEGVLYIFPKRSQEKKIAKYDETLYAAINLLIFDDDKEAINKVIKYYDKNPDFISFGKNIDALPEYMTFKPFCENKKIIEKLHDYSNALCESLLEGINEEYKSWYRSEILRPLTDRKTNKNVEKNKMIIRELHNNLYKKNQVINMDEVPHRR